jgi:AsmA protein
MRKPLKFLLYSLGAVIALMIVAAIAFTLLFDPNDFRERIAKETRERTGRELLIEGDLEVSIFPWLAIGIGKTSLGNAPGFGDEPFASFNEARLGVRLLPLLLRREVIIGTAELDSLQLNLQVARDGRTNWDDLAAGEEAAPEPDAPAGGSATLDIAGVELRNSAITYSDAQSGETYRLTEINMSSGRIADAQAIPFSGGLAFELQPAGMRGTISLETVATFDAGEGSILIEDLSLEGLVEGLAEVPTTLGLEAPRIAANTKAQTLDPGDIEIAVVGIDIEADVEPFSYAGEPEPAASIRIAPFSPRNLMERLAIEPPPTADPEALGRMSITAKAKVSAAAITLTGVELELDDTTLTGELSVPREEGGFYRFDFAGDTLNLSRYMAPAGDAAETADVEEVPVEIPVDLIRSLNARGSLKLKEAYLGAIRFENVELGLNNDNGNLRIHPISAGLFEGSYSGDVRVDASGATPVLSVNEQIRDVRVGALVAAMFDTQNVSGTINGAFQLSGRGADLAAIQRSLGGNMSLEVADGALEGIDIWYQLRRARALFRQETPPEPSMPPRTPFSNIRAAGPVSDGVFDNNELRAELPFMQVTGKGTVDIAAAKLDYRMTARVLDKPELMGDVDAAELKDLTKAAVPFRVSGPLAGPSVSVDIESLVKEQVEKEIEDQLIDKLFGGRDKKSKEAATAEADAQQAEPEPEEEKDVEEQLKDSLKDLFKR